MLETLPRPASTRTVRPDWQPEQMEHWRRQEEANAAVRHHLSELAEPRLRWREIERPVHAIPQAED